MKEIIKKELTKIMSEACEKLSGECNDKNNGIIDRCIILLDILEGISGEAKRQ